MKIKFPLPVEATTHRLALKSITPVKDMDYVILFKFKDHTPSAEQAQALGLFFSEGFKSFFKYSAKQDQNSLQRTSTFQVPKTCQEVIVEIIPWRSKDAIPYTSCYLELTLDRPTMNKATIRGELLS